MRTPAGSDALHLPQLGLDAVDHAQRVLAEAHDDDAADDFALAVELGDAAPDVRPEPHLARRRARGPACRRASAPSDDLLDVVDRLQVAAAADHVLAARELEQASLDVVVARANRLDDVLDADVS